MPIVVDGIGFNTASDGPGLFAGLDPDYQAKQIALKQATAFQDGLPTLPGGGTDWNAAAAKLLQLGDYANANNLLQLGMRQSVLGSGGPNLDDPMGRDASATPTGSAPAGVAAPGSTAPGVSPNSAMQIFQNAIGGMESSNKYDALGPVTKSGDQAYGRYQVMGSNVGPWTQEVLGTSMSPQEFLANPQAQDAVFNAKFGQSLKKYGNPQDAASVWFTGKPYTQGADKSDQLGTSGAGYVSKFMAALPRGGGQGGQAPPAAAPYTVASNAPVAAPSGQTGVQPQPSPTPSASTPPSSSPSATMTPVEWASKLRPNDPTLGQRMADALGVDPSEGIDPTDPTIRKMVLPVLQSPIPAAASNNAPVSSDDEQPVSGNNPYAYSPPSGPDAAAGGSAAAPGTQAFTPVSVPVGNARAASGPQASPAQPVSPAMPAGVAAPAPIPTSPPQTAGADTAPPPVAPPSDQSGPDFPGLPRGYQDPGGGVRYLGDLSQAASRINLAGFKDEALDRKMQWVADQIKQRQAQQNALALAQARANDRFNAANSPQAIAAAGARAGSEAAERAKTQLVPSVQLDGSTIMIPQSQALTLANNGQPIVSAQPGYVTTGQGNLLTKLNDGSAAYQTRQQGAQRLNALSSLLETFQTGANSTAFNDAVAQARSLGINIPNSATTDPGAMQQFTKDAYANVLSSMKEMGNRQYASEVQAAVNSNPNPDLQPEANAAMIAQMQGIQRWNDQNFRDYSAWYHAHPGAPDDADFQTQWVDQHPLGDYVAAAAKDIAPVGAPLPPKSQLVDGQAYRATDGSKMRWSASSGQFVPFTGPTPVGSAAKPPQRQAPAVGAVINGYRYKGGDPSQQSSWGAA